ncbi:MAG: phosphatase PAP2 family protein [Verrucomicrobiota bacterium]
MPAFRWSHLLVPLLLLALGTVLIRLQGIDLRWMQPFFREGEWHWADSWLFAFLYRSGTTPAIVCVVLALVVLGLGFVRPPWARFRKLSLFAVVVMVLGPGLLVNALLKDQWGRPRPREVVPFDGPHAFEPVLTIDPSSPGKSFPCGHCSMGFYFCAGYLLLRRSQPRAAWGLLLGGLAFGSLMGLTRMAQGGHFPSDVLWSAGSVWFAALLAFPLCRLHRGFWCEVPASAPSLKKVLACLGSGLLALGALFLLLLATPIELAERFGSPLAEPPTHCRFQLVAGEVSLRLGETYAVEVTSVGHGLPGAGIRSRVGDHEPRPGVRHLDFKQRVSGVTSELVQGLDIEIPQSALEEIDLTLPEGDLTADLTDWKGTGKLRLEILGAGSAKILLPVDARLEEGATQRVGQGRWQLEGAAGWKLDLEYSLGEGALTLQRGPSPP